MSKIGTLFIFACMAVVAGCAGAGMVLRLGGEAATGAVVAALSLVALLVGQLILSRGGDEAGDPERVDLLAARLDGLARNLDAVDARLLHAEAATAEGTQRLVGAVREEIAELGDLLRELAEQVDGHDAALARAMPGAPPPAVPEPVQRRPAERPPPPAPVAAVRPTPVMLPPAPPAAQGPTAPPAAEDTANARVARLRAAVLRGAIDLHLQPVMALPQRKILHYGVLARLRDDEDAVIPPSEIAALAKKAGLQSAIDTLVIDRTLRIARRLKARRRSVSLFLNIAPETFASESFAADIARRFDNNSDLGAHIVLEFRQAALRTLGGIEGEMLASIAEKGFRFGMNGVADLGFDARSLHAMGVCYVRLPHGLLFDGAAKGADIHPADLPGLFKRHGILLIAEGVESESTVADLLDIEVAAADGPLFGLPRPVRPEIFVESEQPAQPSGRGAASLVAGPRSIARSA